MSFAPVGKGRALLLGGRRLRLGEEVDPDQAASSPTCRIASPTATARLGAFSVSHSPETDAPAMSIWRKGFRISTGIPNRSFNWRVEVHDARGPARDEELVDLLGGGRGEEEVEGLLELLGEVLGDRAENRQDLLQRLLPRLLPLLQGLGLLEARGRAASGSRRCTGCRRRRCRARRSCSPRRGC